MNLTDTIEYPGKYAAFIVVLIIIAIGFFEFAQRWSPSSTTDVASISTRYSGDINALTSTIVVAGLIVPKTSPCAFPTSFHVLISVTKIHVRITTSIPA